ncbi:thiamine phosphate synthase [Elizabethkingia argentiflava]|uniref:Thiamine-phosphate synthase n=1 Tax=Elizabethkingia argenteiflava TaxID=2681556 RepID=A0A845PR89_9FLAO|nr:thiamine phosphate synthase [Elizabethkingia argenteiflava]NAW50165.1 thiamine phosphate synthase [Elizabethkingia argenteiflava]
MLTKLQYISQGTSVQIQENNILKALRHGAEWIQIRWKNPPLAEAERHFLRLKNLCRDFDATCIINDYVQIASAIDADGVHLGLTDTSVEKARKILGNNKIIGGTANTISDVQQRLRESCDYIGLGPYRFTSTKEKLSPILGIQGYRKIFDFYHKKQVILPPVYAIGGIGLEDIEPLKKAGIYGVAISGLLVENPHMISIIKKIWK